MRFSSLSQRLTAGASSICRYPYKIIKKRFWNRVSESDAMAARHFSQARELIAKVDLDGALAHAMKAASLVETSTDHYLMYNIGTALDALGERDRGLELIAQAEQIRTGASRDDWQGENISDRTLLVVWRRGDIGIGIRSVGLVAHAARRARHCIVLVEPRLIPLYRRTLEGVDIRSKEDDPASTFDEAQAIVSFTTLAALFGPGSKNPAPFLPLRPDPELVATFRAQYQNGSDAPLVGISWSSAMKKRQVPPLTDWETLLRSVPATYVSLQYGNVTPAVEQMRAATGARVIEDQSVNQLVDMDRFAAQVAALDAIVSIPNSISHTAGALGTPSVAIIGNHVFNSKWTKREGGGRGWSNRNGWCPNMRLVHRQDRDWPAVMQETGNVLETMLRDASRGVNS